MRLEQVYPSKHLTATGLLVPLPQPGSKGEPARSRLGPPTCPRLAAVKHTPVAKHPNGPGREEHKRVETFTLAARASAIDATPSATISGSPPHVERGQAVGSPPCRGTPPRLVTPPNSCPSSSADLTEPE